MGTVYDADITGDGQDVLTGGAEPVFAAVHVSTLGTSARIAEPGDPRYLRLGWFSFGDTIALGIGTFDYFRSPIWIDFTDLLWTPDPSTLAGTPLSDHASLVRWHLFGGAVAHLYVYSN